MAGHEPLWRDNCSLIMLCKTVRSNSSRRACSSTGCDCTVWMLVADTETMLSHWGPEAGRSLAPAWQNMVSQQWTEGTVEETCSLLQCDTLLPTSPVRCSVQCTLTVQAQHSQHVQPAVPKHDQGAWKQREHRRCGSQHRGMVLSFW